jgi:hypothetical protein
VRGTDCRVVEPLAISLQILTMDLLVGRPKCVISLSVQVPKATLVHAVAVLRHFQFPPTRCGLESWDQLFGRCPETCDTRHEEGKKGFLFGV